MTSETANTTALLTANLVSDDEERMQILPRYFGARWMMRGEARIQGWMRNLCEAYDRSSGYWDFYELSNNGFFMVPRMDAEKVLLSTPNGDLEMTPEAAGIVASLYGMCDLANMCGADHLIELYHAVRDFALQAHPERNVIRRAID